MTVEPVVVAEQPAEWALGEQEVNAVAGRQAEQAEEVRGVTVQTWGLV